MNAHSLTIEEAEASHIDLSPAPSADEAARDLEDTVLGSQLLELLRLAQEIDNKAAKREGDHVINGRRHMFRATDEERLAEQVLNTFGPPEDCFFIREVAERAVA